MWKVTLGIKEEKHLEKIEQDDDNCDEINEYKFYRRIRKFEVEGVVRTIKSARH